MLSLFGILMTAIFGVFKMGAIAWHKASVKNELLQQTQLVNFRLARELELSALESLSVDKTLGVVAFLSPLDGDQNFVVSPKGRPEFQKYVVYYRRSVDETIYRRELPLIPSAPVRNVPRPIEEYNSVPGKRPLSYYATGGHPVAKFIKHFKPDIFPDPVAQLRWEVTAERKRYGTDRPESVTTVSASLLRN